jgi:integrase
VPWFFLRRGVPRSTSFSSRVLTPTELGTLWRALDGEGVVGDVFRVPVLTGQRIGEVRGMRWDEIDLETGWWTIPGTRTKNKKLHRVPLVGEALRIVRARTENRDGEFVFPGPRKGGR